MRAFLKSKKLLYAFLAFNVVFFGVNLFLILSDNQSGAEDIATQQQNYPYLSKRIFAEDQNDIIINFTAIRSVVREYIDQQPDSENIGFYFEYLPSGTSINANDEIELKIASLVKIPTTMAIYKKVENGQLSLDQKITIQKDDLDGGFGELWKKGAGAELTVREAVDYTLTKSDNTAHNALKRLLDKDDVASVMDALNIPLAEEENHFVITPKNYVSILRSLYLSSYLQREDSNGILDTLNRTEFNDQIRAPIPQNIAVSHKIGVLNALNEGVDEEVHSDCGIVYIPNRPYALCIMVKGANEETAKKHMGNLSALVYGYVSNVKK